ncbi:hypothetical protein DLAC_05094 [Tieghemostelium lacteum]|uniref:Telomeric single stranded DNA binding POT1/Cdc13 domain-containing protein n=1 Tax=Tieghemostelium lacteum TaxID=361077 RepID=A0A151ZIG9_TIELA|nr:hypothetical protein DLAC_05094 [Tieghemostelium lacteum]|eukprot:KYQ93707.1 hypothetical protein DLAC_05094 [Tieghemostelium lacteum]
MNNQIIYRKIKNITQTGTLYSIYCVVVRASEIKKSKEDYFITLKVTDETLETETLGINLFFKDDHYIEFIKPGTIIRFHDLKITKTGDHKLGTANLDAINSTKIVIQNDANEPISLRGNLNFNSNDEAAFQQLRQFYERLLESGLDNYAHPEQRNTNNNNSNVFNASNAAQHFNPDLAKNSFKNSNNAFINRIGDLVVGCYATLTCQIVSIKPIFGPPKRLSVGLWDGTGHGQAAYEDKLGMVIYATAFEQKTIDIFENFKKGDWLYIERIYCKQYQNVLELKFQFTTKIQKLENDNIMVLKLKDDYGKAIDNYNGPNTSEPSSIIDPKENFKTISDKSMKNNRGRQLTRTEYSGLQPVSTIQDVIASRQCPNKYLISGVLKQHFPLNVQDFTQILCKRCDRATPTNTIYNLDSGPKLVDLPICKYCQSNDVSYIYLAKFIVADETGEIELILHYDAPLFFQIPPLNFYLKDSTLELQRLQEKISNLKLSNMSNELCIVSYYQNTNLPSPDTIRYQIVDTLMTDY